MKITKTKILLEKADFSQIIFVWADTGTYDKDHINYIWNDNIAKPDRLDDFTIVDKNYFSITNVGVRINMDENYAKKYLNNFDIEFHKKVRYGIDGRIANILDMSLFPIPSEFILGKKNTKIFKKLMKK